MDFFIYVLIALALYFISVLIIIFSEGGDE